MITRGMTGLSLLERFLDQHIQHIGKPNLGIATKGSESKSGTSESPYGSTRYLRSASGVIFGFSTFSVAMDPKGKLR